MENLSRRTQKLFLAILIILFTVGALSRNALAQAQIVLPTPTPTLAPAPIAATAPLNAAPLMNAAPEGEPTPQIGISGQVRLVSRISESGEDGYDHNVRGEARVDGFLKISECVQLRTRISTGDNFNTESLATGIGPAPAKFDINIRHLYIDSDCLSDAVKVEAGAIPVRNHGYLGLSSNGWIDGLRVTVQSGANTNASFSIGNVQTNQANVFRRDFNDINHVQLDVEQKLTAKLTGYTSVAAYNDMLFTRGGLRYALTEFVKWIEAVGAEGIAEGDNLMGGYLYSDFNLGDYNLRVAASRVQPNVTDEEKLALLIKDFYGFGDNLYVMGDRDIAKNLNLGARLRIGDAGQQFELRLTHKFKVQN